MGRGVAGPRGPRGAGGRARLEQQLTRPPRPPHAEQQLTKRPALPRTAARPAANARAGPARPRSCTTHAGNHRVWLLSALRAHTKEPHKTDPLWETQRALNRPGRARTVALQNRVRKPILSACGAWPCAGRTRRRQPWPRRRGPRPPPRSPETAAAAAG